MKKAFLSPLCSALIIPGFGQLLNEDIKKGVLLLLSTLIPVVAGLVTLYHKVSTAVKQAGPGPYHLNLIIKKVEHTDCTLLWLILSGLVAVWIYSIVDAYIEGKKTDKKQIERQS